MDARAGLLVEKGVAALDASLMLAGDPAAGLTAQAPLDLARALRDRAYVRGALDRPLKAELAVTQLPLERLSKSGLLPPGSGGNLSVSARLSGGAVETVLSNPSGTHRPDPDRMFDRFYRADPSRSAAAGGVGLGLSISRELAAAMKGRLWADFDDAGNLRVHLMLPASRDGVVRSEPSAPAAVA